ncbi:hypothetical protein G6011_01321 [Alternaria panax]|uniref:Uncharacterized protein n=1 Tax=Alternaria panax TaxID=48097 RepID=A0AAD4IKA8_9PLEO|nr:hypothetical protein G6011_01321 [Alternaria panax]
MEIEAPTFISLNKSQKRALILRDQLRFVDPQHLNQFLEGISNDEPPTYTKVNGVIKPELILVTLKEQATHFDLGNVQLPEEQNSIYRVYLVVENGQIQMRAEDPLPQDENVLDSQPIHGFIARTMVPMFKEKFQIIFARMNKINEARRTAYNMPNQAPVLFHEGETLARLNPTKAEQYQSVTRTRKLRKREPNEEVVQHVSNKRKRTSLATIPKDAKCKIFDTIPSHVKVDLFNSIVDTAFPNFNNLMVASWNVITIYTACGSDFPELHRAIVDLKGVLRGFDESFGQRVDRTTTKYRNDFGGTSQDGADRDRDQDRNARRGHEHHGDHGDDDIDHHGSLFGTPVPTLEEGGAGNADQIGDTTANKLAQLQEGINEHSDDMGESEMPLLRISLSSQPHEDSEADDDEDDQVPPTDPRLTHTIEDHSIVRQSGSHHMAELHIGDRASTSANSSPSQKHAQPHHGHAKDVRTQQVGDYDAEDRPLITLRPTSPKLTRRREVYAPSVGRKHHEEQSVGKAYPATTQNIVTTRLSSADETGSYRELDQQTPQLQDSPTPTPTSTSTPKPRTKKQREMSDYTIVELEERYKERKAHILTTSKNNMSKVPEKHRKALELMEATIETRKKDETQEKADKKNHSSGKSECPGTNNSGMFGNYPGNPPSNYLGNSVLGAKKPIGVAPVAPMFPNGSRKDPRDGVAQGRIDGTAPYGRSR